MKQSYHGKKDAGFGNGQELSRPFKRPVQARSRFTVQAIYDGLVRITLRQGWMGVSMRSLATETGYAVGTIYEYSPDREAVLSGYVRYAMEARYAAITNAGAQGTTARARIEKMVTVTLGLSDPDLPEILPDYVMFEPLIAGQLDHQRVFRELVACWDEAMSATPDLCKIPPETIKRVVLILWGTFRYALLVDPKPLSGTSSMADMTTVVCGLIDSALPNGLPD